MFMRPGAVERWRILNGSVDGRGFKRVSLVEGQYTVERGQVWRVVEEGEGDERTRRLERVTRQDLEDAKADLHLLAWDGITLVKEEDGRARHYIKDLSRQNPGRPNPMNREPDPGEDRREAMLRNVEASFREGDGIRDCFVRPNELYMNNAARADVFVKMPLDAAGKVYTLFAQEVLNHTDNFQQRMQISIARGRDSFRAAPQDVVVAYVHVRGNPVEGGDFDVSALEDALPPVPPFLQPVAARELQVPAEEARARGGPAGSHRSRVVSYSGWGGADWPLIRVPESFAEANPELERLVWARHEGTPVLLPPGIRTVAIHPRFDLAVNPEPGPPRKFAPDDPMRSRVLVGTAEEWVLYNPGISLWGHTDTDRFPQEGQYGVHYESYPIPKKEGQARFWEDHEFRITSKGADHPFHIHINPMWVTRIDVPDEDGALHNILEEPRWMDTVPIPRNGGRVVFRTRFLDFPGRWVNHCHMLAHEDSGMMQVMEAVEDPRDADYNPRERVASFEMPSGEVSRIYPRPSMDLCYRQNLSFVDPNPNTGQVFPGYEAEIPRLTDGEEGE
jgi:FtsP/CotA-like multicopper oxidase with cupredoxin domain